MLQISNTSENRRQHLVLMHFNKNAKHSKSARSYRFFLFETLVKVKLKLKNVKVQKMVVMVVMIKTRTQSIPSRRDRIVT